MIYPIWLDFNAEAFLFYIPRQERLGWFAKQLMDQPVNLAWQCRAK